MLLHGGRELAPAIQKLTDAGIMTVARMGVGTVARKLRSVFALEGDAGAANDDPAVVARTVDAARELLADAQAADAAGAAALVLEGVAVAAAQKVCAVLAAPVFGIGSGKGCSGQLVVQSELLGMRVGERVWAKYVHQRGVRGLALCGASADACRWHKKYDNSAEKAVSSIAKWVNDVEAGTFPGKDLVGFILMMSGKMLTRTSRRTCGRAKTSSLCRSWCRQRARRRSAGDGRRRGRKV